jgi:hypothetical protein
MSDEPSARGSASGSAGLGKKAKLPKTPADPGPAPRPASKKAGPRARPAGDPPDRPAESELVIHSGGDGAIPSFARSYPRHPQLDALVDAFEAGNYARVREEAARLADSSEPDEVRRAARDLRRRVDPDPVMIYLLLAAVALLGVLAIYYWTHQDGSPSP